MLTCMLAIVLSACAAVLDESLLEHTVGCNIQYSVQMLFKIHSKTYTLMECHTWRVTLGESLYVCF
jgi:hypothetical protein